MEILEVIFNSDNEIYNYRISKNTPEVEERLARIYEGIGSPQKESQEEKMMIDTLSDVKNEDAYRSEIAKVKRPQYTSFFYVHNINVFSKFRGFEGLLAIVSKRADQKAPEGVSMAKVCLSVLTMVGLMKSYFVESFWIKGEEYGTKIALACHRFIVEACS